MNSGTRLAKLLELFLRSGGVSVHALHGCVDFSPTLSCEFFGRVSKLVDRFVPGFQLGGGLKLKDRLLLPNLFAEAFDIFVYFGLEGAPLRF